MLHKNAMTDPAGTLEKALERDPLYAKHHGPLTMLDLAVGEVLGYPFQQNPHSKALEVFLSGLPNANDEVNFPLSKV